MEIFYCTVCGKKMADIWPTARCGRCRKVGRKTGKLEWKCCRQCGRRFTKIEHLEQEFARILWRKRMHTYEISREYLDSYESAWRGWNTSPYCPTCSSWRPDVLTEEVERAKVLVSEFLARKREVVTRAKIHRPKSLEELNNLLAEIHGTPTEGNREEFLYQLLPTLTSQEEQVLRMRYGVYMPIHTLEEIGRCFGVSKARIAQIEKHSLAKLFDSAHKVFHARPLGIG